METDIEPVGEDTEGEYKYKIAEEGDRKGTGDSLIKQNRAGKNQREQIKTAACHNTSPCPGSIQRQS